MGSPHPFAHSFTIVVTDNDSGQSYDHTFMVDRALPEELLFREFTEALLRAASFHGGNGICPGKALANG